MSNKSSAKARSQMAMAAFLGFVGASSFSGPLRKEILDDDLRTKNNHPPGVENPNEVELGKWVKYWSRKHGWRSGVLVAILGTQDGRIHLEDNGTFVERKLKLIFPVE